MIKKILIVEDEAIAAQHLERTLREVVGEVEVEATLQSIEETVEFFMSGSSAPDLVFMDIHLADGLAFRIFEQVDIPYPIIFTTAYDQYALDAFKVNSLDYLLKPIAKEDLKRAIDKYTTIVGGGDTAPARQYRSHFLIPFRDKLIPIEVSQIACLYLEEKVSQAVFMDGRHQVVAEPLDTLMEQLDPALFFRANRQYIVAHSAIREISVWPVSKLALTLSVDTPSRIIVSKARVHEFKEWYTR